MITQSGAVTVTGEFHPAVSAEVRPRWGKKARESSWRKCCLACLWICTLVLSREGIPGEAYQPGLGWMV